MFNVLLKTKIYKINEIFDATNLMAGIIYDNNGVIVDKIMFIKKGDIGIDVFDDQMYSFDRNDCFYIDDYLPLSKLIWDFMKKVELNFGEMIVVFKRFLNDDKFLCQNLDYFGLIEVEVGYKGKTEIMSKTLKYTWLKDDPKIEIYCNLLKIINCKDLNERYCYENIKRK